MSPATGPAVPKPWRLGPKVMLTSSGPGHALDVLVAGDERPAQMLIDVDGDRVFVKLQGTCATCAASQVTLKHYVETKLRDLVTPELMVEEVQ